MLSLKELKLDTEKWPKELKKEEDKTNSNMMLNTIMKKKNLFLPYENDSLLNPFLKI